MPGWIARMTAYNNFNNWRSISSSRKVLPPRGTSFANPNKLVAGPGAIGATVAGCSSNWTIFLIKAVIADAWAWEEPAIAAFNHSNQAIKRWHSMPESVGRI